MLPLIFLNLVIALVLTPITIIKDGLSFNHCELIPEGIKVFHNASVFEMKLIEEDRISIGSVPDNVLVVAFNEGQLVHYSRPHEVSVLKVMSGTEILILSHLIQSASLMAIQADLSSNPIRSKAEVMDLIAVNDDIETSLLETRVVEEGYSISIAESVTSVSTRNPLRHRPDLIYYVVGSLIITLVVLCISITSIKS